MNKENSCSLPVLSGGKSMSDKEMYAMAKYVSRQKISHFETEDQVFLALQVAFSLGMKSMGDLFLAIGNMYFLKGRVSLWGDLPMALITKSGFLESIDEFFINKDYKKISIENKNIEDDPICAVFRVKRKKESVKEFYLTLKDLERSGNYKDGNFMSVGKMDIWKKYPKLMWAKRLRRWALSEVFSDVLKGISLNDDVSEKTDKAKALSSQYKEKTESRMIELYDEVPVKDVAEKEKDEDIKKLGLTKTENTIKTEKEATNDGLKEEESLSFSNQQISPLKRITDEK